MIYLIEFRCAGGLSALDIEDVFIPAVRRQLAEDGFEGLMLWPTSAGDAANLILEGQADPRRLAAAIVAEMPGSDPEEPIAEVRIHDRGEPPPDMDVLPAEERLVAIVRMAVPRPGEACGRCESIIPP